MSELDLLDKYQFSQQRRQIFHAIKAKKNLPTVEAQEMVWAVAVATVDIPDDPTSSDMRYYERIAEERIRKLEEAEKRYGWYSHQWTRGTMKRLINNWFCGMLVIDPDLQTQNGSPIQFVHEFYGEESNYPDHEGQTDEWKKSQIELYVLMARSICKAYPNATSKGIVSFSDMQDFDWDKYDMESKSRNADIGSLVPNKLVRMITVNPDDKMRKFYEDMSARARKKWGFAQYEDFESAMDGEGDFLPSSLPTFVGGTRKVDILKCLKHLFSQEPEALALMLETHSEMVANGELPQPSHMAV